MTIRELERKLARLNAEEPLPPYDSYAFEYGVIMIDMMNSTAHLSDREKRHILKADPMQWEAGSSRNLIQSAQDFIRREGSADK